MGKPEHDLANYLRQQDTDDQITAHIRSRIIQSDIPDYYNTDTIERYTEAEIERLKDKPEAPLWEIDDWHNHNIEYCTCAYFKAEMSDEYAESMDILGADNVTRWRMK